MTGKPKQAGVSRKQDPDRPLSESRQQPLLQEQLIPVGSQVEWSAWHTWRMHRDHSVVINACTVKCCSCFLAVAPSALKHASSMRSPIDAYAHMTNACRMPSIGMVTRTQPGTGALLILCPLLLESLGLINRKQAICVLCRN